MKKTILISVLALSLGFSTFSQKRAKCLAKEITIHGELVHTGRYGSQNYAAIVNDKVILTTIHKQFDDITKNGRIDVTTIEPSAISGHRTKTNIKKRGNLFILSLGVIVGKEKQANINRYFCGKDRKEASETSTIWGAELDFKSESKANKFLDKINEASIKELEKINGKMPEHLKKLMNKR